MSAERIDDMWQMVAESARMLGVDLQSYADAHAEANARLFELIGRHGETGIHTLLARLTAECPLTLTAAITATRSALEDKR